MNSRDIVLIGKTNSCPKLDGGDETDEVVAVYATEMGMSEIEEAESKGICEYWVLIMQRTNSTEIPTLEKVNHEWNELFGGSVIGIEFLTDDRSLFKKSLKEMFDEGPNETFQFKLPVAGYIKGSELGEREAKNLLTKSSLKKKWEFWK